MALGDTIRRMRTARGLTLADLAKRSGVSVSMLSRIERGEKNPTVPLACRIAEALETTLSHLVGEQPRHDVIVIPRAERPVVVDPVSRFERHILSPTFPSRGIEFLLNVIPAGASSGEFPPHRPGVEEYLAVAQGILEARLAGRPYRLGPGDALYFAADVAHQFTNVGRGPCTYYLVINSSRLPPGPPPAGHPAPAARRRKGLPPAGPRRRASSRRGRARKEAGSRDRW